MYTSVTLTFNGAKAMSIFDTGKACTFSAMSGVILNNGEPVKNALIKRETHWQSKVSDETTTDEKGYFEFPARFERSIAAVLPQEFVVTQKLFVLHEGKSHEIWTGVKRKKEENTETDGGPIVATCNLDHDDKVIFIDRQPFSTKCVWNVTPKKPKSSF